MIPEAAVEAAIYAYGIDGKVHEWERKMILNILEAAAPHMLAEVTTRVEQVNMPNGAVILSEQGGIFQHFNGYWFEPASSYRHHLDDITLPATVLYRPTK